MTDPVLLHRPEDRIAVLTLNRPDALNAIDRPMVRAFRDAIRQIEADDGIDLFILAGAGAKAFCVGIDLKERQTLTDDEARTFRADELFPMYAELEGRTKPAIAAVNGHCLAGGFELALSCDMMLATARSSFGLPEVKWGLIPAAGGCRKLPKLIGAARAKELILTASSISAAEAERLGIVNRLVQPEQVLDEALALARRVLTNMQVAVRGARRCIDHALQADDAADFDIAVANECYASRERKSGIARFGDRKSSPA